MISSFLNIRPSLKFFKRTLSVSIVACLILTSCSDAPEPDEYVNYLDRFFTFSKKGVVLTNKKILSTSKRGFADLNGDGLEDMFEITDIPLDDVIFKFRFFEGYIDKETNLLNFLDPYVLEIPNGEKKETVKRKDNKPALETTEVDLPKEEKKSIEWGDTLKIDVADVNGDGLADFIMSQFTENWGGDDFDLLVVLNKGVQARNNKIAFRLVKDIVDHKKNNHDFKITFLKFIAEREAKQSDICIGSHCNTSDRFSLEWADMDGNGTDDLIVLWRESRDDLDISMEVFYTNASVSNDIFQQLIFASQDDFELPKLLIDDYRNFIVLNKIHFADINGDEFDDFFIVAEKSNKRAFVKFGLNMAPVRRYDGLVFMTDATTEYPENDWDLLSEISSKIDMLDINFDGCADYVHMGESTFRSPAGKQVENAKTLYYMLTDCKKAKSVVQSISFSKNLTGVKWPQKSVPKETEEVMGLSPPVILNINKTLD